nr:uncharacterized protein LOC119178004 [Rhipicephalus microplus]
MDSIVTARFCFLNDGRRTFVRRGATRRALDLSLVSEECHYTWQRVPDTESSDHYPIIPEPLYAGAPRCNTYSVVNWPRFRELCATVPVAEDFLHHIVECASAAMTVCRVPSGTPVPDIKLLNLRAADRLAQRRAEHSDKADDWTVYNHIDAVCRHHAHQQWYRGWSSLCHTFDDPRCHRRAWRIFWVLLRPRVLRQPELSIAVVLSISTAQLAKLLADTVASLTVNAAAAPAPQLPEHARPELFAPFWYFSTAAIVEATSELCSVDFTITKLRAVLDSRKRRSVPGNDGITYTMLRNIDGNLLSQLLGAFNTIWRTEELPPSWKEALVIPIYKKGKATSEPPSYHPVSLTSAAGKTFEDMALWRLQWIATALDFLAAEQSGFRAHRATADSISDVISLLEEAKHQGEAGYLVLFDVRIALDSLPHPTSWTPFVKCVCATNVEMRGSIPPPGSINDYIPLGTAYEVRVADYAVDIALFTSVPTSRGRQVRESLQAAINAVASFISGVGLELSATKTEGLLAHPCKTARYYVPKLRLRGHQLPWRKRVRYLGLTMNHRLSWKPAIADIREGSRRSAGMASRLIAGGTRCSPDIALRLYNAVASPEPSMQCLFSGSNPHNGSRSMLIIVAPCAPLRLTAILVNRPQPRGGQSDASFTPSERRRPATPASHAPDA